MRPDKNVDHEIVSGFGDEWNRFDQSELSEREQKERFEKYFDIFPWHLLPEKPKGFDLGCGSGRWAKLVAPRVGHLHCIDPSSALTVAKKNLSHLSNCEFHSASVDDFPVEDASMDFGYSIGVLHHIPDTQAGMQECTNKLKPGAPFLVYLYYAFDNRPRWFIAIWKLSDSLRKLISGFPHGLRYFISQIIALFIYFPIARFSALTEKLGFDVSNFPLSAYRGYSFYTMRTDALDRFGTRLEKRFSREQIKTMMEQVGLEHVEFSSSIPYWCAVGYRKYVE